MLYQYTNLELITNNINCINTCYVYQEQICLQNEICITLIMYNIYNTTKKVVISKVSNIYI